MEHHENTECVAQNSGGRDARLSSWLHTARELLWELMNRKRLLTRLLPQRDVNESRVNELEYDLEECEKEIAEYSRELATIEDSSPLLGARILLGAHPSDALRCSVVVLVMSRLWCAYDWETDTVGQLCGLVAGGDPDKALLVRDAFRVQGALRKHVHIERRFQNIDAWRIGLTESAFAAALGQEPDPEQMAASLYREFPDLRRK